MSKVRVRFAPSPTGHLHIGSIRSALYNYLFARHHGGDFLVRIEDTDRARYVADGVNNIIESLAWAGLSPDEGPYLKDGKILEKGEYGPYTQSLRLPIYKKFAEQLVTEGKAYPCFCMPERLEAMRAEQMAMKLPPKYDGLCRRLNPEEALRRCQSGETHVIRMAIPKDRDIAFDDLVRGRITINSNTVDDQVLMKSDGYPTYHLAVVVDDHAMQISHVIRAEEWLTSTPKHILLYEYFGWKAPEFAHLSQLLNPDKSKLSKRQGDVAVIDYARAGYLPEAVVNFIALLGWNPSGSEEIYSVDKLIKEFDISKVGISGSVFNREKLDWMNGHYLRAMSLEELTKRVQPFNDEAGVKATAFASYPTALRAACERAVTLQDIAKALKMMSEVPEYKAEMLVWKKSTAETAGKVLHKLYDHLKEIEIAWKEGEIESILKSWVALHNYQNGDVFWPLRIALSGAEKSPPPFTLMEIYGREESLKRVSKAMEILNSEL